MMHDNWMKVQFEALLTVNRDNGIECFRLCGIPGSDTMYTENGYKQPQIHYM